MSLMIATRGFPENVSGAGAEGAAMVCALTGATEAATAQTISPPTNRTLFIAALSVENRLEKCLHRGGVIRPVFCKRRLGSIVRFPIEKRVSHAAQLNVLGLLSRVHQRVDKILHILIGNQLILRATRQELRHGALSRRGDMFLRSHSGLP